jgi:diguanylate cyclase (GGDEF)-like protein
VAPVGDLPLTTVAPLRTNPTAGPRRPWESASSRTSRQKRVLPFLALLGVSLVIVALPPGEPGRFSGLALAALGFLGIATLIVVVPWERLPAWPRLGIAALYCADVALVRESTGGARSGFAIMLLLVVVWQAAYGNRAQVLISLAMTAVTTTAPIVLAHGDRYPDTEWRRTLLFTVVAGVIGLVVHELVRRTSQERWIVGQVADLGRSTADGDGPHALCRAALELTGADTAIVFATVGEALEIKASAGIELPTVTLQPELVPDLVRQAITTGQQVFVSDVDALTDHNTAASTAMGVRSWVHQPAGLRGGGATVVLSVAWFRPRRRVPAPAALALPLLANEAASSLHRAELVDRLDAMTRQDPLTGLVNRRGWDDHLTREIARVGRTGRPLSIALLDLDRFKAFNDAHGHLVGDQLLKAAAGSWSGALRTSDVLARWGGEEFVVLMPETSSEDAEAVLARMARRTPMDQTFSAGLVTVTTVVDPDALVAAADRGVYRAKSLGRDRIEVADPPPTRADTSTTVD